MIKHVNTKNYSDSLTYHKKIKPGKLEIAPTKPLMTSKDLSLAYTPGVAAPCLEIFKNPEKVYDYTTKGNTVAIVTNGSAVLGLGNLGPLSSKPVMEGKSALFKRFADIDAVDIEVDTQDPDKFVNTISLLSKSWGGINLEDIKAPECFVIEKELKKRISIPVFHDDQHGTAIITSAGLINALDITGKKLKNIKIVINGAGAAGIACTELLIAMGVSKNHIVLCDTKGIIHEDRNDLNPWKRKFSNKTLKRTLSQAFVDADVAIGLSSKDAFTKKFIISMASKPIVFALANPDPEILPNVLKTLRPDAIIATGRSDYPNQINNVLGFPFIFRGALDVRASKINLEMKIAAAKALAKLAREKVPSEVKKAYNIKNIEYGNNYIIPTPFDPRLISSISYAVAKAAMSSGVAKNPIKNSYKYKKTLSDRLRQTMKLILRRSKRNRIKNY